MAQPVWRLPRGVRAAAIVLSLAGLIGGVRVLDAQIAGIADPVTLAGVESESLQVSVSEPMISQPVTTSPPPNVMIVESLPKGDTHRFLMVKVTGYTSGKGSADEAAPLTAVSRHPRPGTIALSRDLLRNFTPGAPFSFGDRVVVPGMGIYVVEDTMHPRWTHKADIWFADENTARRWGNREVYITRINPGEPLLVAESWHRR